MPKVKKAWEYITNILSRIPIVGALFVINPKAIYEAGVELTIVTLFSTLPIWFGSFVYALTHKFTDNKIMSFWDLYSDSIVKSVSNGELLMYAAATLGPTFYLAFKFMNTKEKPFPWVRPQLLIAILVSVTAAVLFFTSRNYGFASAEGFVLLTSTIYLLTLVLLFPSMAYEHEKVRKPEEAMRKSEVNFMAGYKNHRSGE